MLAALAARPSDWRHGYDLARETGLKSGTLHPILVAFAADHPRPLRPVRSWAAGLFVRS